MGFLNWILKNGPGSPGSTASAFVKLYEQAGEVNHQEDWEGLFLMIFMARYQSFQRMGFIGGCLLNKVNPELLIKASRGDLAFFVFIMMIHETAQFRNNLEQTHAEVTKVIHEVIKSKKPNSVTLPLFLFQQQAKFYTLSYTLNL